MLFFDQKFHRLTSIIIILSVFALSTSSCIFSKGDKEVYVIPEEDTVEDQYAIAQQQQVLARGIFDRKSKEVELRKAIQAYQLVESRFPNDLVRTPAAALQIAEIYSEIEEYETAASSYLRALETYPEDPDIRVVGLLRLGESLDELGRYEEAKVYFKLLIDEYKSTGNPEYKRAVERARNLYRQIR